MTDQNPYGLSKQTLSKKNIKNDGSMNQLQTMASQGRFGDSLDVSGAADAQNQVTMMQSQTLGHNISQETLGGLNNLNRSEMLFGHESQEELMTLSKNMKRNDQSIEVDELDQMLDVNESSMVNKDQKNLATQQSFRSTSASNQGSNQEFKSKHELYLHQLEMLTSDNCPKRHPFDFGYEQLKHVKAMFPEHKSSGKGKDKILNKQSASKMQGILISELKGHFAEIMGMKPQENLQEKAFMGNLMEKLDHCHSDKITWTEFLKFLDREGIRREVVNDAQLYGIGVKRLKEQHRVELKQGGVSQIDQQFSQKQPEDDKFKNTDYVGSCVYINFSSNFKLLLALFENTENPLAMVYDTRAFQSDTENELKTVNPIYEFKFKSNYAKPKDKTSQNKNARPRSQVGSGMPNQQAKQSNSLANDKNEDSNSKLQTSQKFGMSSGQLSTFRSQRGLMMPNVKKNVTSTLQDKIIEEGSVYSGMSAGTIQPKGYGRTQQSSKHGQRVNSEKNLTQNPRAASKLYQSQPRAGSSQTQKRQNQSQSQLNKSYNYKSATNLDPIQEKQSQLSNYNSAQPYGSTNFVKKQIPILHKKSVAAVNRNYHEEAMLKKLEQKKLITQKYSNLSKAKCVKMPFVLGIDPLIEEEGSSAYLVGKDMQKDTSGYGIKFLLPNLHQVKDEREKKYNKKMAEVEREIKRNDRPYGPVQVEREIPLRENVLQEKIDKARIKQNAQEEKLKLLCETNKHFYGVTASSPRTVALEQEYKRQLEKKGIDTTNFLEVKKYLTLKGEHRPDELAKRITNNTADEIAKYVARLKVAEKSHSGTIQFNSRNNAEHPSKLKRRQQMEVKKIYAPCAAYNSELQLLVLALIDREIKVYQVKQNGKKINFVDIFQHKEKQFTSRFIVTCLCIERYVSDNRPILCLGSQTGEVAMYYLDEPVINKLTGKPFADGRVQEKELKRSPFNIFNPHQNNVANLLSTTNLDSTTKEIPLMKGPSQTIISGDMTSSHSQFNDIKGFKNDSKANTQQQQKKQDAKSERATEITAIKYIRDIGLVISTFNGTIKFFEAISFSEKWVTTNKMRKENQHTNITTFDISVKMGVMATGGVEGRIILIDPYALDVIKAEKAHACEILKLYVYEEQKQIISIGQDRSIGLWDASRLEKIEIIKDDRIQRQAPIFSSCDFDQGSGQLFIGCQQVCVWKAQVDDKVEINALQVQALSKQILKDRKMLDYQDPNYNPKLQAKKKHDTDVKTSNVLVTQASTLVELVCNQKDAMNFLVSIDSENLLRAWNTDKSNTTLSYRIPVQNRVTAAAVDDSNKFLAVGTNSGETKIINFMSGGVLYNLAHCNSEVTCLKFFDGMTELWLFGACWGGKLMMWSRPTIDNNFTVAAKCRVGHKNDVLSLDCSQNFIVSGGVDGIVSVWNAFSGQLKYAIQVSKTTGLTQNKSSYLEEMSSSDDNLSEEFNQNFTKNQQSGGVSDVKKSVVGLCFHPHYKSHICVLLESGDIHMIDATNGETSHKNLGKAKLNSNWACDPDKMRMFVVGDTGRACLYDISMGALEHAPEEPQRFNSSKSRLNKNRENFRIGQRTISKNQQKWPIVQEWFIAHKIYKADPVYVVSVKFVDVAQVFVSGTTSGEVKIWHNSSCACLGIINSPQWNPKDILQHLKSIQQKQSQPEVEKQGSKFLILP